MADQTGCHLMSLVLTTARHTALCKKRLRFAKISGVGSSHRVNHKVSLGFSL
jgi:hypothetical protein